MPTEERAMRVVLGLVAATAIIVGATMYVHSSIQNIGSDMTIGQGSVSADKSAALPASFDSRFYYVIPTAE
jgi:hypothetical protein